MQTSADLELTPASQTGTAKPSDALPPCRRADAAGREEIVGDAHRRIAILEELALGLATTGDAPQLLQALSRAAHDMREIGVAFSYPLIDEVAGSLCLLLDRLILGPQSKRVSPLRQAAIVMHVRQLRQIQQRGRTGNCAPTEAKLVAGLRAVAEKASA